HTRLQGDWSSDVCSSDLLGENLALFTIALFFYLFIKGLDTGSLLLQLSGAAVLGISILIRPNVLLYGVVLTLLVMWRAWQQQGKIGRAACRERVWMEEDT